MSEKKLKIFTGLLLIALIIIFIICYFYENKKGTDSDYVQIDTKGTALEVEYDNEELTGEWSDYTAKITLNDTKTIVEGKGVTNNGNIITINSAGTYYITGSISDGNILIDADKNDCETYTTFTDIEKSEPDGAIFTKTDLVINGNGKLVVNANYSDGIVSKDGLKIINSNIEINSEDDGIHADTSITINGGVIDVTKSYEGIESGYIEINGGTINVTASDDEINVAGGNDSSSMNGRPGQNSFSSISDTDRKLVINNGNITVNASGDGLDSNGSIYIKGGTVLVAGPTNSGNGALDYDGECVITGGDIAIYEAAGMSQNPSSNSTQYSLSFQTSGNSGDEVILKDSSGNTVKSFKAEKSYSMIIISNANIEKGKTYSLYINGSNMGSLETSNTVTSNSSTGGNGNDMKQNKKNF